MNSDEDREEFVNKNDPAYWEIANKNNVESYYDFLRSKIFNRVYWLQEQHINRRCSKTKKTRHINT